MTQPTLIAIDKHVKQFVSRVVSEPCAQRDNQYVLDVVKQSQLTVQIYQQNQALFTQRIEHHKKQHATHTESLTAMQSLLMLCFASHISHTAIHHLLAGMQLTLQFRRYFPDNQWEEKCLLFARTLEAPSFGIVKIAMITCLSAYKNSGYRYHTASNFRNKIKYLFAITRAASANASTLLDSLQLQKHDFLISAELNSLYSASSSIWCGQIVKHNDKLRFVLGGHDDVLILCDLHKKGSSEMDEKAFTEIDFHVFAQASIIATKVPFALWFKASQLYAKYYPDRTPICQRRNFKIQSPPTDLLSILDKLNQAATEPSDIAVAVANNAMFSQILKDSASQLNRLNLPVEDIKQSVLTHGLDRIASVLTEQALWYRLTQSDFPLAAEFITLCNLHRLIASSLALQLNIGIPQQVSLLATLQLSALFTYAPLRTLTVWKTDDLFNNAIPLKVSAQNLAKAWHQGAFILSTLDGCDYIDVRTHSSKTSQLLLVSLKITVALLYETTENTDPVQRLTEYLSAEQQSKNMELPKDKIEKLLNEATPLIYRSL